MSSQLWLNMSGYLNYISPTSLFSSSFISLTNNVEKNDQSDVATYGGRIHVYIFSRVGLLG